MRVKKNSRVSSARRASSRARGLEWSSSARDRAVERLSARARVVERSSARGRGLYRARRCGRNRSGSLRHAVITVHITCTCAREPRGAELYSAM